MILAELSYLALYHPIKATRFNARKLLYHLLPHIEVNDIENMLEIKASLAKINIDNPFNGEDNLAEMPFFDSK